MGETLIKGMRATLEPAAEALGRDACDLVSALETDGFGSGSALLQAASVANASVTAAMSRGLFLIIPGSMERAPVLVIEALKVPDTPMGVVATVLRFP
jgi:hypothetical protein